MSIPTKRIRLAHAIHSGGFYGAEKVICDLIKEQASDPGLEPSLLALLDPDQESNEVCERVSAMGIPVIRMQAPPGMSLRGLKSYARLVVSGGFDLVHSHGYKPTSFHVATRALRLQRAPLLVTAHGYPKGSGNLKSTLYRLLDMVLLSCAQRVAAVSKEMEDYLKARNPLCNVLRVSNGIGTEISVRNTHPLKAHLLSRHPGSAELPIIGSVGRLVPMKNHALLIRAFAAVRRTHPCRLVIIGDGPLRGSLEELWKQELPGEPVEIVPFKNDILEWMADMDVFTLPSNDGEGLPMALLEAGLLEKAVVCSNSGGIPEVIKDGRNGRLFTMGDQAGLENALGDMVSRPESRASQGAALRSDVLANNDMRATHRIYLGLYRSILETA